MSASSCHPNRLAQARNLCKSCYDTWLKATNPGYKARQAENSKRWCASHPIEYQAIKDRRSAKVKADPLYRREADLTKKYGLTLADYAAMLAGQNGVCALCYRGPGKRPLHVDHNHMSGVVRGLLCHQCNWYLGTVDRDPMILGRITEYRQRGMTC